MTKPGDGEPEKGRRRKSPTLVDVANAAGVSVSTAGRVLQNQGWPVEEALKIRVLEAANRLAYVPNVMARTLRAGAPGLVGLVTGNMLDPYFGEIGEAVTRHAETGSKMLVMVCNMQRNPRLELDYCRRLWEHRVAGLILSGGGFDQFTHRDELAALIESMERSGVVVTALTPRGIDIPTFCVDNERVGDLAAAEMLANGHRKFGILVGPIQSPVLKQRISGITRRFEEAGVQHHLVETGFGQKFIVPAIERMFAEHPDITGVIAASGTTSINAVHAVTMTGRSVPDEVSVIGMGGGALAQWTTPRLTRVDLALETCGRAALDYIAARVAGSILPADFTVAPEVVRGESVAPARP